MEGGTTWRAAGLSSLRRLYTGKVREVYEAGADHLLLVTSNRVSAYDVVFPEPVPNKGEVLNLLSAWWFARTAAIIPNHLVGTRTEAIFADGAPEREALRGRCALVRRTEPIRYECVVRGHLDGSAWREYAATGAVAGHRLPAGLRRYDRLPEPVFTPATKAETGHDENITVARMAAEFGADATRRLEQVSLALYRHAYEFLAPRGILVLDTKFEFGTAPDGTLLLIDEVLTPDSSRYRVGAGSGEPLALDKQYLRDWLTARGFAGDGPPPALPPEVTTELGARYARVFELITGEALGDALARLG
jgi:phosphoribosylaminoimidazole-succinocarboxamide synthase